MSTVQCGQPVRKSDGYTLEGIGIEMANFSFPPTWTSGHGFAIGTEVNFTDGDVDADSLTDIPFGIGGLQIFGGSISYNSNGKPGESVILLRIAIIGDESIGDAGAGPGSSPLIYRAVYIHDGVPGDRDIFPFCVQLNHNRLLVPQDGSAYKMRMHADVAGNVWPTHLEIALAGMWWDTEDDPPAGI